MIFNPLSDCIIDFRLWKKNQQHCYNFYPFLQILITVIVLEIIWFLWTEYSLKQTSFRKYKLKVIMNILNYQCKHIYKIIYNMVEQLQTSFFDYRILHLANRESGGWYWNTWFEDPPLLVQVYICRLLRHW